MPDLLDLPSYTDPAAVAAPELQKKPDNSEMTLREYIEAAGDRIGVPKQLRDGIYGEESGFSHYEAPGVVKRGRYKDGRLSGALGVSQLMPATAKFHGVDINDPIQNAYGGLKEQKRLYDKYITAGNSPNEAALLAAAAYNAGEGAVEKYHGIPPFAETQGYVTRIGKKLKKDPIQSGAAMTAPVPQEATSQAKTQPAPSLPVVEAPKGGYLPHVQPGATGITPETQAAEPNNSFYGLEKAGVTEGVHAAEQKNAQDKVAVDTAFGSGVWDWFSAHLKPEARAAWVQNAQHVNTISDFTRLGEQLSQEQDAARRAAIRRERMRAKVQASKANQQRNSIIEAGRAEMITEAAKAAKNADPVLGSKILTQAITATPADVVKYMRDRGMRGGFDFNQPAPGVDTVRAQGRQFVQSRQPINVSGAQPERDGMKAAIRQQVMAERGKEAASPSGEGGQFTAEPSTVIEDEVKQRYDQMQAKTKENQRLLGQMTPDQRLQFSRDVDEHARTILGSNWFSAGLSWADLRAKLYRLTAGVSDFTNTLTAGEPAYSPEERRQAAATTDRLRTRALALEEAVGLVERTNDIPKKTEALRKVFNIVGDLAINSSVMLTDPILGFGMMSAAQARGHNLGWGETAKQAAVGAATGAAFKAGELFTPAGPGVLEQAKALGKQAATIGGGTFGVEYAAGTPAGQALESAITNVGLHTFFRAPKIAREAAATGAARVLESESAPAWAKRAAEWWSNYQQQAPPSDRAKGFDAAPRVEAAIDEIRKQGPSPEAKAFFAGVEPRLAGTTIEKVSKFAENLGIPWEPDPRWVAAESGPTPKTPTERSESPSPKQPQAPAVEPAGEPSVSEVAQPVKTETTTSLSSEGGVSVPQKNLETEATAVPSSPSDPRGRITQVEAPKTAESVDDLAHVAAHSPTNDLSEPTDAQKEAGNYKKGKVRIAGLDISIENPQGSIRSGVDKAGHDWSIELKSHYGYIRGYEGRDKDHVDIFVKPGISPDYNGPVFVVNQRNEAGRFDEHKVMLGWGDKESAKQGYIENYDKRHKGIGSIASFANPRDFKHWLDNGDLKKVAQDGKGVSDATDVRESQGQVRGGRAEREREVQSGADQGGKDLQREASRPSAEAAQESDTTTGALKLKELREAGAEVLNPDQVAQGAKPKIRVRTPEPEQPKELARITPKQIVRHSDPNIDGGEVVGRFPDGDLKVQNKEGGISRVQDPRREGNREAAVAKAEPSARRGIQVKAAPVEDATEPIKPPPSKRIFQTRQEYVSERMRNLAPGSDPLIAQRSAIHEHEYAVKRAVKTGKFAQLVVDKELTNEKAIEILKSLGGTVPNYIKRELAALQGKAFDVVGRKMAGRVGRPKSDPAVNSLSEEVRARGGIRTDPDGANRGEIARLKESGKRGLVDESSGMLAEDMAGELAQDGYFPPGVERDAVAGHDVTNVGDFINAVADDAAGSTKYYSTAYDPSIEGHPDDEAFFELQSDEYGKELLELVQSGHARAADIAELARVGREHGLSDEGLQAFLRAMDEQVKSEISETSEDKGYSLDDEGTLLDPDGQPLFSRIAQPGLGFGDSEGLLAEGGPQPISEVRSDSAKQKQIAELNRKHADFQREREQEVFGEDTAKRLTSLAETKDRVGKIAQTILNDRRMASRPDSAEYIQSLVDAMETVRGAQAAQLPLKDYLRQDSLFGKPVSSEVAELAHGIEAGNFKFLEESRPLLMAREQTESDEFKQWFGDSKVVDEAGEPRVLYHGTYHDFAEFDTSHQWYYFSQHPRFASHFGGAPAELAEGGNVMSVYLSIQNPLDLTSLPALRTPITKFETVLRDAGIEPDRRWFPSSGDLFVQLNRPSTKEELREAAIARGYDGIVFNDHLVPYDDVAQKPEKAITARSYIAFNAAQVKSAIGNLGTFDPSDPNILRSSRTNTSALLDGLKSIDDDTELIHNLKSSREADIIWVNPEGQELLRRMESESASGFFGIQLDRNSAIPILRDLKAGSQALRAASLSSSAIDALHRQIVDAIHAGKGHALVVMEGESSETAIKHESFHQGSALGAAEKPLSDRHTSENQERLHSMAAVAKWRRYFQRTPGLTNASKALAIEETAAEIAGDGGQRIGLTEQESAEFIYEWAKSFYETNGPKAFEAFRRQEDHVNKAIEAAKRFGYQVEAQKSLASGKTVRGRKGSARGQPESSVSEVRTQAPGLGRRIELRGEGEVREASLPETLSVAGLDTEGLYYQGFTDAQGRSDAAELLERHGVEGSLRLLKDTPNPGKEHAVLSFMVQRLLLDQAATASAQGDEAEASRLRSEQQELAAAHASHATHSGQFNQAAASAGVSVETALTVAQRIVQNEFGASARVNPKIAGRIEEHARSAEQAFGETMALTVELGELRKRVAQLERERGARNPRNAVRIQLEAEEQGLINVVVKAFTLPPGAPVKMAVPAELSTEAREALAKLGVLELIRNPDGSIEDWNASLREKIGEGVEPYLVEAYTDAFALRRTMLKEAREAAVINEFHKTHPDATEDELADYLETQKTARERAKLVSGEKATKTRLLIRINELKTLIETGEKSVKGQSATNQDIELLKSERDRLQGVVDEMAGPKPTPEDKRIELATKALRKSIADYDKRIAEGQVTPEPKSNVAPWSEELGRLQTQRAHLRKQLSDLRKQANAPQKTLNAIAAQLKVVTKSIGELEARIQAGNIAPRAPGTSKPTNPQIEAAKAQRAILAKLLADMRRAARPRQVKTSAEKEAARHLPVTRIIGELAPSNIVAETAGKILFGHKTAYSDLLDAGIPKGQAVDIVRQAREIVSKAKQQAERERLANSVEKDTGRKALDGEIDRIATERLLAKKRGSNARAELAHDLDNLTKSPLWKAKDVLVDLSNSSRSILAAGDLSAVLRQGGFLALAYPEKQAEPIKLMLQAITELGELKAKELLENDPVFGLAIRAGIDFAELGRESGSLVKGEEVFRGDMAKKIPGIGAIVRASDRTYATFLDAQRLTTFRQFADELQAMGYTFRENPQAFRDVARLINIATGRGHLLGFGSHKLAAFIMNLPFFSPRNTISRFQLLNITLNPVAYARLSPGARKIVARSALRYYGMVAALLGLASLLGFKVVMDWNDPDFLKIRSGNTRFEIPGGVGLPARLLLRLTDIAIRGGRYPGERKEQTIEELKRFGRGKLAPGPALAWDWYTGENYQGQTFRWFSMPRADKSAAENVRRFMFEGAIAERVWMLPIQDVQQAWHQDGFGAALKTFPATELGVGATTYKDNPLKPTTRAERLAAQLASRGFNSEPEPEEKGDTRQKLTDLRARSMKNEDVKSELDKMVQSGEITNAQAKNVEGAKGLSKLEYWVRKLPPDQALLVVREGSVAERRELLPLLYGKVQRAAPGSVDAKTQTDMAKLSPDLAKLFEQRKPVESELVKHDMKFPEADAKITIGNREIKLTGDKLLNYQKRVDALVYERLPKVIQSSEYQGASPSIQKKMLQQAEGIAHSLATAEIKTELAPSDRILAGERRALTKRDLGLRKRAGENVDAETNAALAVGTITVEDADNLRKLTPPAQPFSMPKLLRRRAERRQDINERRHPVP